MDLLQKYQELRNSTVPRLFLERVRNTPNEVAYRTKKLGIYKERTWFEFYGMVSSCAWDHKLD
jgi:long-subunit acyl-CoA synthetase (AMP-forming)